MKVESIGLANELDWNVREELRLTASPTEARTPLQGRDCHIHFCIAYTKHSALPCRMHTHIFGPIFQEKIFHFDSLIQLFIYLYLETKWIIVFQGISLYTDIIIAF